MKRKAGYNTRPRQYNNRGNINKDTNQRILQNEYIYYLPEEKNLRHDSLFHASERLDYFRFDYYKTSANPEYDDFHYYFINKVNFNQMTKNNDNRKYQNNRSNYDNNYHHNNNSYNDYDRDYNQQYNNRNNYNYN